MPSDNEPITDDIVSERETQFIPRSDDDEVLWDVQEITAERGNKYKVKWAGTNPATGKPWAQSWVAKHDCTDKLVVEWKTKKKGLTARVGARSKKRGRRSAAVATDSSTLEERTRHLESETPSSRLNSIERSTPAPPQKYATKRKRRFETSATTSSGAVDEVDEGNDLSRPQKKQKMIVEVLLPPISTDEGEDDPPSPAARAKVTSRNRVLPRSNGGSALDVPEDDKDSSPPKAKSKSVRRTNARSKGTPTTSRTSSPQEGSAVPQSKKTKTRIVSRHRERVTDVDAQTDVSQDEALRPSKSKKKAAPRRILSPEQGDSRSGEEVKSTDARTNVGPPLGVKRREKVSRGSGSSSKPGPLRTKPQEMDSAGERVPGEEPNGHPSNGATRLVQRDAAGSPTLNLPPLHISEPQALQGVPPCGPDLSPGSRARLELFDRMMTNATQSSEARPANVLQRVPDDTRFNYDDTYDAHGPFDTFDPSHPLSPPPSGSRRKRSKPSTPSGLIVPETESSRNSQSQPQSLLEPPSPRLPPAGDRPPHKQIDLPTIAVISASATFSCVSPQDIFPPPQGFLPSTNHPPKRQPLRPMVHMSPSTFRSTINAGSRVADSEAPPSSIESFTSPKRVDKGKQRAVEDDDQLQSSLSEGQGGSEHQNGPGQRKITDTELRKRGKEIYYQAHLMREAEQQKKKKNKQKKTINDIVNGTTSPPLKESPLQAHGGAESTLEMRLEEVLDLNGGANGTTLDTQEHSEAKPMSEEERERLRMDLRQEEEESTQEEMNAYPLPSVKQPEVVDNGDIPMPPPRSPKSSPFSGHIEDADHAEQPSTDLLQDSVIVQVSQGQAHEDTDIEPSLVNPLPSSPPRSIPENLTDSPKRKLGEALSLLNVKSEEIQRLERELADERKNVRDLKAELAKIQQYSESTAPVLAAWEAERAEWAQERSAWENDRSLWKTQCKEMSEEITSLSARVVELSGAADRAEEARAKLSELEAERVAWTKERDTMLNDPTVQSKELVVPTNVRGKCDEEQSKWELERASWLEEKANWETERAVLQEKQEALLRSVDQLTVKVESLTAAKVSTEKDRDFFREQYAQASEFVGSVREENVELGKRVKIAEGQAQEGVAVIKAFSEGRIKALQADVDRWKGLTELLQEKDRRTNDELRQRAAQAPELRDFCGLLDAENKSLRANLQKLERAQQRSVVKRRKLYYEILALKKEKASLRSRLSQAVETTDSGIQDVSHSVPTPPILEDPECMDASDMAILLDSAPQSLDVSSDEPALFPCMWRPQWRDQCQQVFDTKEDLERHLHQHFRDLLAQ